MAEVRRAANFSANEKHLLLELVQKFAVIENKETDKFTVSEKNAAWKELAEEFSAASSVKRTAEQLKQAYSNIKKMAKKSVAREKVEHYRTGGGTYVSCVSDVDEKALALLGNRATPLPNPFDSDATYSITCLSTVEEVTGDNTLELICLTDDHVAAAGTSTDATTSAAPATSSSTSATVSALSSAGFSGKKWAGRRRSRPSSSSAVATAEAAAKISISIIHDPN